VAVSCHKYSTLKDDLLDELLRSADDVCTWINFLLISQTVMPAQGGYQCFYGVDVAESLALYSTFFSLIIGEDPRLKNAFVSSPIFGDLLLRCWMVKDNSGQLSKAEGPRFDAASHLASVMLKALKSEIGRDVILQRIHFHQRTFSLQIGAATMDRAAHALLSATGTLQLGLKHFGRILRIVHILTTQSTVLRIQFIKIGYLKRMTSMLHSLDERVMQEERTFRNRKSIITLGGEICHLIFRDEFRVMHSLGDVIDGGLVAIILRVLSSASDFNNSPELIRLAVGLLDMLGEHLSYDSVIKKLPKPPIPQHIREVVQSDPISLNLWREFWDQHDISWPLSSSIDDIVPSLCDNQFVSSYLI
jgi:hypothetical protein